MNNNRGNIIIGYVIAVSMAVVATFMFQAQLNNQIMKISLSQVLATSLEAQRITINSLITSSDSLAKTQNAAENSTLLSCKTNPTFDCPLGDHDLVLYDQSGAVALDSRVGDHHGFSNFGVACNTFDLAGNDECPYRFKIVWTPDCPPAGVCLLPTIIIKASVLYSPLHPIQNKLNPSRFNFYIQLP